MRRLWLTRAVLICGAAFSAAPSAEAQQRYTPYQPSTPTISPWMNLYQRNPGPLDNYNTYVRPQIQLRDTLQQQDARIQRQGNSIHLLGQEVTEIQQEPTVRPTGSGAGYMNYSHYYPSLGAGGQTPRAAAGSRAARTPPPARTNFAPSVGPGY
jgi:hypothetical protein